MYAYTNHKAIALIYTHYNNILDKQTSQLNEQVLWRYQGAQKVVLALKSSLEELSSSHLSEQQPLQ